MNSPFFLTVNNSSHLQAETTVAWTDLLASAVRRAWLLQVIAASRAALWCAQEL